MLVYLLYSLFFLSCFVLVAAVLLQPGKTDAGALFTSNVASSALAPRGTATVLSKITIVAAMVFMFSALLLSMPALTGDTSVLLANPETTTEQPSSAETTVPDANANTVPANEAQTSTNTEVPASEAPSANTAEVNSNAPANK